MNILIDARESGTSTGRYIDKLIENLQKIDSSNEYTLLLKLARLNAYSNLPKNFRAVECNVKEFTFKEQIKLKKIIENIKPDLVHFGMVQQPIFYRGKTVTTMHDLTTLRFTNTSKNLIVFRLKQLVYRYVNLRVARKSSALITPSEFVKNDVAVFAKINSEKITVTYESADKITDQAEQIKTLQNKKFIMYVGRHQPHKNLDRLIEAHQKLLEKNPEIILAIAGKKDAITEILENKVTERNYKNIVFTGFVSEGQLRWLYENCEAYVFPSLSEGFGLPGLEAMTHGAPVVSSNATCLPEIYGDAAEYFDPMNVEDMASKISLVINNAELKTKLIDYGKIQVSKYSWKKMAEQTLDVYNRALEN